MDLAHRLAETLRRLRQDAGLTQVELARRLRMKQSTLNRLENASNNATLRTLDRPFVDRALMDQAGGFQRELDKGHAREFRRFVDDPDSLHVKKASAPPLIFSLRKKARFEPTGDGVGVLHVPDDARAMTRLDAQHRMAETSDVPKSLPFIIYYDLTPEEEVGLFTIINDKHKGLTKS